MKSKTSLLAFIALGSFVGCGTASNAARYSGGGGTAGSVGIAGGNSGAAGGSVGSAAGSTTVGTKPTPMAYVGLFGDDAVAFVDPTARKVVATVPVSAPDGLVVTPDGAKVYVSSANTGKVDVIDTVKQLVAATIDVGTQPQGISITPDGRYVVVSVQGDGQVAIVDTSTNAVVGKRPVGKAHSSGISPDGKMAFVTSQVTEAPAVDVIDLPTGASGPSFRLTAAPRAVTDLNGKLYATLAGSGSIAVLDASDGGAPAAIETAGSPHDVRPTIDGKFVLTVSQTGGELELIDPASDTVIAHVGTGKMPHWIGLTSDGAYAYVTNEGDDDMVLVDLATRTVDREIAVGKAPRKIAVAPGR
jgi:YVTN family beta-propeller protein